MGVKHTTINSYSVQVMTVYLYWFGLAFSGETLNNEMFIDRSKWASETIHLTALLSKKIMFCLLLEYVLADWFLLYDNIKHFFQKGKKASQKRYISEMFSTESFYDSWQGEVRDCHLCLAGFLHDSHPNPFQVIAQLYCLQWDQLGDDCLG